MRNSDCSSYRRGSASDAFRGDDSNCRRETIIVCRGAGSEV